MLKQETKLWVELGHPVSVTVISDCNQSRTKHFCPATHPILSYGLPPKKSSIRPRSTWLEVPSVFVRGSRKNWVGIGVQHPSPGRAALLHRRRDCSPPDDVGQDKQTITLMVMEVPFVFLARLSLSCSVLILSPHLGYGHGCSAKEARRRRPHLQYTVRRSGDTRRLALLAFA